MGLFKKRTKQSEKQIVSVVIIEQTNLFKNTLAPGISFGGEIGDMRVVGMPQTVPNGTEYSFCVTYSDGTKEIIKAVSGTSLCDRLLQLAVDCSNEENSSVVSNADASDTPLFELGRNQLPCGVYIVGKDIPVGTYDFTWAYGCGVFSKFRDSTTLSGDCTDSEYVGIKEKYESKQILNVKCEAGEYIRIKGNLVVSISKSKAVIIDL